MIDTRRTGQKCYAAIRSLFKNQKEMSEALGVTQQAVCHWKRGVRMPSIDNIELIAEMTGNTLDELIIKC